MRIAICFSGQMRTAVHAAPQIVKWLGPLKDKCDFFIHTWDINTYKGFPPGLSERLKFLGINLNWNDEIHVQKDIPLETVELTIIKNIYGPKTLVVDDFSKISSYWTNQWYTNYYKQFNLPHSPGDHWNPLYYSFSRSIELKREYEKKEGFEYDIVLKMRPDVTYPLNRGFVPVKETPYTGSNLDYEIRKFNLDRTKFYASGVGPNKLDEAFWYGNSKVMDIAAEYWHNKLGDNSLNMVSHIAKYNVKVDTVNNTSLTFHRIMAMGCPAEDWPLIYVLEGLFNGSIDYKKLEADDIWKNKLYKAFRDYGIMDIFCKIYDCTYAFSETSGTQ